MRKLDAYKKYVEEIKPMLSDCSNTDIAKHLIKNHDLKISPEWFRKYISKVRGEAEIAEKHPALADECSTVGLPIKDVKHYWYKGKQYSIFLKGENVTLEQIKDELIAEMREHSPTYGNIYYSLNSDPHLLVIDPADIHLNKLCSILETGEDCDHDVIYKRVKDGVQGILNKAQGFPIEQILFIGGNDILHVDSPQNTTTSGTRQDVSLMWYDAFRLATKLMVECIEMLLPVAPVHFQYNPSNHDFMNGFFLAQTIETWFRNCEHATFDVGMAHRKYYEYGENLIGTTHGDGAKDADLPMLMAHEAKNSWAVCKHRYIYTHHIHHKKSKDYMSVCVESLRSPSGTDSWHHRNGYQHAPKAVEGYIHHRQHGQIARLTNIF